MGFQWATALLVVPVAIAAVACATGERPKQSATQLAAAPSMRLPDGSQARAVGARGRAGFPFRKAELRANRRVVVGAVADALQTGLRHVATRAASEREIGATNACIGLLALNAAGIDNVSDEFQSTIDRLEAARRAAVDDASPIGAEAPILLVSLLDDFGLTGRVVSRLAAVRTAERICEPRWLDTTKSRTLTEERSVVAAWVALAALEWRLSGIDSEVRDAWDERLGDVVRELMPPKRCSDTRREDVLRGACTAMLVRPMAAECSREVLILEGLVDRPWRSVEEEFLIRTAAAWIGLGIVETERTCFQAVVICDSKGSLRRAGFFVLNLSATMRLGIP